MNFSLDNLSLNNFSLNESNVLSAVRGGGVLGLINSVLAPSFGIYYAWNDPAGVHQKGGKPFSPDSFVVVEVGAEASVSTAPVEQGAYTTFNKIQRPPELHVTFTVEGGTAFSGAVPNLTNFSTTSRSNVLETLEMMRTTAGLYDIETPDKTWTSYDLVKYDYRTRSNNGPTLLTVTRTVDLSDEIYRRLILMKAMSNITDCSVPDINRMLRFMFGKNRRAYVLNNGGLRMSYIFEFALSSAELAIIQSSGALPSPPGVYVSVVLKETSNEA